MLCSVKSELVVWNPCTGQIRKIEPTTCYCNYDAYALGYTTSSSGGHRSYKILRRFYSQNDKKVVLGEISDSWRVLDDSFPLLGYSVNRIESFLFDEENKVVVLSCAAELRRKFVTRIYISDEYMEKQVYEAKISTFDWPHIITYAPSLVHIPKSTPKKRQKKQRLCYSP
ncbi:hypothetical protein HID58_016859 [Brassica napus]|uniref:F-box associated beta-propeller type 1 domain-containing protein n=1 Tax=Brassica napus TaxID=3708 RepID=A0ABQ8D5S5_BRANA|nr:hypothetical protein HID58_016859 [Brassica napus]